MKYYTGIIIGFLGEEMTKNRQTATIKNANELYDNNNYKEAVKIYKRLADKGNEEAALKYAYMLYNGEGVEVSKIEAAFYFKKLADSGFEGNEIEEAQIKYANMLSNGDEININKEEALKYYKMVLEEAEESDANKIFKYGKKLYEGTDRFIKDIDAAKLFYKKAADLGNEKAKKKYEKIKNKHLNLEKEEEEVRYSTRKNKYLTKGKEEYSKAKEENKKEDGKHYKKAAIFFMKAANQGSNTAMFKYSKMLENGIGIEKDEEKAAFYCREAAARRNIEAIFEYAKILEEGNILKENKENTGKFYKLAADFYLKKAEDYKKAIENEKSFNVKSKNNEQFLEISNSTENQKTEKKIQECNDLAIKYYRKAAHKENLEAMIKYGEMLEKGIKVDKDEEKAANYYKQAADLGSEEAKDKLKEYNKQNTLKQNKFRKITVQQKPNSILTNKQSESKKESLEDIRKSLVENYSKNIDRYIKALYRQASLLELNNNKRAAVEYYKTVLKYCENNKIRNLQIYNKTTININDLKNRINELDSVNIKIGIIKKLKDQEVAELIKTQLKNKYGFEFVKKLGAGTEGTAYLVKKDGREFVVKIPNWSNGYFNSKSSKEEIEEKNDIINLNKLGFTTVKDTINLKINGKAADVQIEIYEKKIDLNKTIHNYAEREKFKPFAFAARSLLNLNSLHNISNIIHRDLKPDNMLFDGKYLPELADFGLSKSMGNVSGYAGSPKFEPAELLNKSTVNNVKTDVYSMGASIYEAFTAGNFNELLEAGERERVNINNLVDYTKNIDKKITKENIIDEIDFTKIFPNVNFNDKRNKKLLNEVQTELLKFFKGTLTANPDVRFTTNEAMVQFRKVLKKCQKMVKTNGEKLDLTEDLGIPEQDLYRYGIFNDKIVGTAKSDYIYNIENLLNDPHLVSEETIECLKTLLNNANEKEIDISFDDNFRKNLETLKEKDKTKYLLITKEIIELKKLKLASKINELKKEKNKFKNVKNVQELEKVKEYRRKLKELYNMSDMIIKIKQNKEMAKHLLSLESNDRTKEFEKACKNNNIFAVKVLLNSANKKEKETMIRNINVCYKGKNTMLYNLLNKDNMDKDDIRDAEFLIANGASFGKNILCYNDLSENIKNNLRNNLNIIDEDGKNYTLSSMLNFVSNKLNNNILSNNLEELKDIDELLGINEESKTIPQHS